MCHISTVFCCRYENVLPTSTGALLDIQNQLVLFLIVKIYSFPDISPPFHYSMRCYSRYHRIIMTWSYVNEYAGFFHSAKWWQNPPPGLFLMCSAGSLLINFFGDNDMKYLLRGIFILLYLLCILVMYLSTVDKYDVIYDMDPSIPQGSLNTSGNGSVFLGLVLLLTLLFQAVFIYFESSPKWKWIAILMAALAIIFFFIR